MPERPIRVLYQTEDFASLLTQHLRRRGLSANKLGLAIGIHPSHLNRIGAGLRKAPARALVEAMARGLGLNPLERSQFYVAAGYTPPGLTEWDAGLQAYCDVLGDARIPEEERAAFTAMIVTLAQKWRGQAAASNGHAPLIQAGVGR